MTETINTEISPIERVGLARHPQRPYTLDIIKNLFEDFVELHGDRRYADDPALVGGTATYHGLPVVVIGHQKGRDVNERRYRNFGMPKPEGYRKALRLMNLAGKFNRPVITFIDTPGAYPGVDAEERGQAEAIAYNLREISKIKTPLVTCVVGEGGSGGALAIGICDGLLMLENAVYSVISPEGCAAILWKSPTQSSLAASRLKLTAFDLKDLGVVDVIIDEPSRNTVSDSEIYQAIDTQVRAMLLSLLSLSDKERQGLRFQRMRRLGKWLQDGI